MLNGPSDLPVTKRVSINGQIMILLATMIEDRVHPRNTKATATFFVKILWSGQALVVLNIRRGEICQTVSLRRRYEQRNIVLRTPARIGRKDQEQLGELV